MLHRVNAEGRRHVLRRRRVPPADHRRRAHPRRADRHRRGGGGARARHAGRGRVRRAAAVPGHHRRRPRRPRAGRRTCTRRARWSRSPPTSSRWCCSPRRGSGAPTSWSVRRSASACRWATAVRTPGFFATRDEYRRNVPGPSGRRVGRRRRAARAAPRAADARAAHPPREGHQQHLHRAGAARQHRRHVRRVPRPRRPARHRRAGARAHDRARRHPARRRCRDRTTRSSTRSRVRVPDVPTRSSPMRTRAGSTSAGSTTTPSASRSTRPRPTRDRRRGALAVFGVERRLPRAVGVSPAALGDRTSDILTHPVFRTYHSETQMLRYLRDARRPRPRARPHDDPARVVHDEAQRHHRDDADHLARVRRHAPVRARRPGRGLRELFAELEAALCEITGYDAVSLQPNAGSQGELAGLLAIRAYHASRGRGRAHGVPHPGVGARHQRGERGDGGHAAWWS